MGALHSAFGITPSQLNFWTCRAERSNSRAINPNGKFADDM